MKIDSHPQPLATKLVSMNNDGTWFLEWSMSCRWCSCKFCSDEDLNILTIRHPMNVKMLAQDQRCAWLDMAGSSNEPMTRHCLDRAEEWNAWGIKHYELAATEAGWTNNKEKTK